MLGAMGASGLAGFAVGGPIGALVGSALPYAYSAISDTNKRIMDDPTATGSFQARSQGSVVGGLAQTAPGMVPIVGTVAQIARPATSLLARAATGALVGGLSEAPSEMVEEAIGKAAHKQFSPNNPEAQLDTRKAWLDYLNAGLSGFALGAATGGVAGGAANAVTGAAGGVVGGATVHHPQIMGIAQRHPEGWQGFAKEHSAILDEQDKLNLERYSSQQAPEPVPDTAFGRKLQEIQDRDGIEPVYQDLLGQPRKEYLAQRQQRQATLDRLGKQFFFSGQLDPKDPEAATLMQSTPEWENILDSYAEDKKDDWLRERLGSSAEQSALSEFEPEERLQLALLRDLAKDPKTRPEFLQLAGENSDLLNRYEGLLGNVSRTARAQQEDEPKSPKTTLDPSAGRSERALGQQAEGDYTAEGFGSDLAFADQRQLNPGYSEQETSNDYRLGLGGTPWKSTRLTDKPWRDLEFPEGEGPGKPRMELTPEQKAKRAVVMARRKEDMQRRWEKQVIEELPVEAQEAYKALYAPESAVDTKWRRAMKAGELTPEQQAARQAEKAAAEAQVSANLTAWREARDTEKNPEDEWGQKLNNTDLRPVPLRRMVEEEYAPEDEQQLKQIIQRDFLAREKPEVQQRYADDPIAYAEDYEVLNKPKMPAVISGRDELTPTRRELVPELRPRDKAALAQVEKPLEQVKADQKWVSSHVEKFTPEQKAIIDRHRVLKAKAPDIASDSEELQRNREEHAAFYAEHKDLLGISDGLGEAALFLEEESRRLGDEVKTLNRKAQPVIVDRPNTFVTPGQAKSETFMERKKEYASKRIPIEQYNVQTKKWVPKAIDPMQLVIQEMSRKKNFSADPDKFVDEVAAAFQSGLAGILYNKSLGIRLDTEALPTKERVRVQSSEQGPSVQFPQDVQIDPETIIYSRKDGGLQLRWKDLEVKGNERMTRIMDRLRQQYRTSTSPKQRESLLGTVGSVKQDMRKTVEGVGYVATMEEQLARQKFENDPAALKTELTRIEQQRKSDLRAIGAERGKERWLSEQDGSAVPEMGDGLETTAGEAQPLPLNQSNRWVDNMAREAGPYAPDKKEALAAREPTRWASKPLGVKKIAAFTDAKGVQHPAREIPNGYEVSPKGDRRFSQFGATLKDGRNIDTAFKQAMPALRQELLQQATKAEAEDVARRQEIARKKGLDPATIKPREIKERSPTPQEAYPVYKALWQQWHAENPGQLEELRKLAAGRPLTDRDMRKGAVSPARALAELLDETAPKGVTESQYAALPGQKPAPKRATPTLSVVEMPTSYAGRTQHNADQAEVTAAFAINNESTGERQTARAAGDKLVQWDGGKLSGFAQAITSKLQERQGTSLNVAGNGMVRWAERGYDQEKVTKAMFSVLRKVKEEHPALERVVTGGQTGSDIAGAIAARALGLTVEVNMPKGFKQLVPGGTFGKTVNRTQAEVESYIENEAKKLLAKPQETMANPPKAPQGTFGVYGQSRDTVGPPVMPKPSANLRPEAPSRSAGEVSTTDLKRAAGVPNGPPPKRGVFDNDLASDRPTSAVPAPAKSLPMTPQRQVTQARAQAAPMRIDPELTRAEALASPPPVQPKAVTQASPNVGMARPDPRAVPGQTRLSLKEQPAPDPRIGDRRPAPGYQASGQIPFTTTGVKPDGLRPQEVQQQAPTDAKAAPLVAAKSVAAPAAAAQAPKTPADVKYQDLGAETPDSPERFQELLGKVTQAEQALPKGQTQREAAMAGQVLKALGINAKVRQASVTEAAVHFKQANKLLTVRGMAWQDADGTRAVYLNPALGAEARIEVLGHELGHIIYKDSYQSASAETKAAIEQAFNTWRDQHGRGRVQDAVRSRTGVLTINDYFGDTAAGTRNLEDLSEQDRSYILDFEEWFADQTSRWLVTDAKPMGLVQQFFHDLANRIRDLLKQLRPNAPDAEVAKFLNGIFEHQVQPLQTWGELADATNQKRKRKTSPKLPGEAKDKPPRQWTDSGLDSPLPARPQAKPQAGGTAPPRQPPKTPTKAAAPSGRGGGRKYTPPSPTAQAAQASAVNPFGAQARQSVSELFKQLTAEEQRVLGMAFRAAPVQAQLRKRLASDPVALDAIRNPDDAIAYGFQFWQAGDLKLGPRANSLFQRTWNRLNTAIGQVTEQDQAEALLQAYQQGRLERRAQGLDNFSIVGQLSDTAVRRGYQKLAQTSRPLLEMLRKVAFTGHTQMTALENPHIDRLAELIYNEVGTEGVGQGMLAAQTQEMGRFTDRLHTIFDGKDQALGEQVLDVLTKRVDAAKADPAVQLKAAKVYQLLQEIYQYTRDAGVALPSKGEVITLAGRKVNNYFPRVLDVDYLQQHSDEFVQMLMQDKYKSRVKGENNAREILGVYIRNFGSETEFDPDAELGAPQAGAFKKREFDWIEDADMAPFLSRNLGEGMVSYIHQAVKRVEFLRRFGDGKYAQLLERARAEGLQPEQEERVTKYMQGVMGTLGADINPTLNTVQGWILVMENWMILALSTVTSLTDVVGLAVRGDFDTAWQGLKAGMKEVVALAQQDKTELRELAEALGTIEQHTAVEALGFAYGGYQITGMARKLNEALFKYNLMQGWTRGTRLMGLATAKAFVAKHGQRKDNATSQRFLDQLGLREGDVQVKDGELTILSYAERRELEKQSEGLLADRRAPEKKGEALLGGKGGKSKAALAELARDDRVRAALNQFTDEAILRPNAAMRPIWANDPHAMLLFHMKSFTYAFHERILKRVLSEAAEGNYMPMVRFLGYTPAMMAAIALQDAIQGDDDDKPFEEDLWNAAQRSGMPGAFQFLLDVNSDSNYGNVPGTSLLGPTAEHLIDWADAAFTDTSADSVAMRTLPLQNLWRGHFD